MDLGKDVLEQKKVTAVLKKVKNAIERKHGQAYHGAIGGNHAQVWKLIARRTMAVTWWATRYSCS